MSVISSHWGFRSGEQEWSCLNAWKMGDEVSLPKVGANMTSRGTDVTIGGITINLSYEAKEDH